MAALLSALCLLAVGVLLLAEARRHAAARAVSKSLASVSFVGVALALDAAASTHGRLVLGALVLSLVGDLLLLSAHPRAFLGGLVAFLLAHLAYAAAFLHLGVAPEVTAAAAAAALLVAAGVLRWLRPSMGPAWRVPVAAYVVVIMAMCTLAIGHAGQSGAGVVALGAVAFAASDLAVAREKFVRTSFVNKAWGLPLYYAAQLLLAWSVAGPA